MAGDPAGSGSFLAKFYFVLVHVFLFLLGFFVIQKKAKEVENEREKKEKQENENKTQQKEKSFLNCLNNFTKSCYQFSGSTVHMFVEKWLSIVERNVEKELKVISVKQGVPRIVSSIEIERNEEIPLKIESMKQHWQKDNELILDLVLQTKPLKFKVVNSKKETSFFVLPSMNLKGLVYVDYGKMTQIRYIEVKALREIKLTLSVAGKHKEMCNYIAEALNVVFMKPKKIAIEPPTTIDVTQNTKTASSKEEKRSIQEESIQEDNPTNSETVSSTKYEKIQPSRADSFIPKLSNNFIAEWPHLEEMENEKKLPPKQNGGSSSRLSLFKVEQRKNQQHRPQLASLKVRAKSVPYELNSSESTASSLNHYRSSNDNSSDTSSIFFEPISPLSPSELSKSFDADGPLYPRPQHARVHHPNMSYSNNKGFVDDFADVFDQQPSVFAFTPVNSYQALQGSLTHTFDERNNNMPGFLPSMPRTRESQRGGSNSSSSNTSSSTAKLTSTPHKTKTPSKIHNAIEPQFTVAEVPQTIKTPILHTKDDSVLKQRRIQLTKNNVMRHSFHHNIRPKLENAQSLGSLSRAERSESPKGIRGTISQISLNSAIGYVPNKSSALVIETLSENDEIKYYHIPPAMVKKGNYPQKGQKLHVYNDHIFTATHFTGHMPSCCVCNLPLKRMGKQGYSCRDCNIIVHKRCHCKIVETCPMTSLPNMEIEYVGGTDV